MPNSSRGLAVRRLVVGLAITAAVVLFIASRSTCLSVGFSKGLWLDECPDGELRQTVSINAGGLKRKAESEVIVSVNAIYVTAPHDQRHEERITRFTPTLVLVSGGTETVLEPKDGWKEKNGFASGLITLPAVNDGDYVLRAKIVSAIGSETLDAALPLYTPARVHLLTDRPLYEPGNTVQFRALALKGTDLTPLEERPGTWTVSNPLGEVVLEEKAPSGAWGVVSGSFPLDRGAPSGEWQVTWRSGGQTATRFFTVKPFTLPRFRLEASPLKPFYGRNERPVLKGSVKYSSGAPVANAALELKWHVNGEWPAPTSWNDGTALPKSAKSAANGTFTIELPQVPDDLQGTATVSASIGAVDASGDRIEGSASVLLSRDTIAVQGVTELGNGLIDGFNNRLFLRATTADGRLLDGVTLNVKRLWEATDKGVDAPVDEDGVASMQIDPGPAVNVVIPAMPFRPPPAAAKVTRQGLNDRLGFEKDGDVTLADRMAFDRLDPKLAACTRFIGDNRNVTLGILVHAGGSVEAVSGEKSQLSRCVQTVVKELKLERGPERFFEVGWYFNDEDLPKLSVSFDGHPDVPEAVTTAISEQVLSARECLPATVKSGQIPRLLMWSLPAKSKQLSVSWSTIDGEKYAESAIACISSKVKSVTVDRTDEETSEQDVVGTAQLEVSAPEKYESVKPQDTIMIGYELLVTAKKGGETIGSSRLRMTPGAVPPIRLRAASQLVNPGEQVTVEIVRGPDFTGELPEKMFLTHAWESREAPVDKDARKAVFTIPDDWQGWAGVQWGGGQVHFFVKPRAVLSVKVTPEKDRYAPGQVAMLGIETMIGEKGGPAAVGLFGVDDSLSQLASLPGPDELASLRPQAIGEAAFGSLDAQALSLGRIRGANAAAATLARVSSLPPAPEQEVSISVNASTTFDPNEAQVDRFYVVLGELYGKTREWETKAPANEKMTPATMAKLWNDSLDAVEARKESARDGWGRKLRLHRLPADLLALTEPRQVVINGTRLPEDTQNWSQWVAKEQP